MKNGNRKNRRTFKGRGHVTKTKQLQTGEYPPAKATQQSTGSHIVTAVLAAGPWCGTK